MMGHLHLILDIIFGEWWEQYIPRHDDGSMMGVSLFLDMMIGQW